jgi:hypothetical protein
VATVTIRRAPSYFGRFRRLKILLDEVPVAHLKRNASVDLEVAAGRHLVQAKLDWLRSQPWVVEATDARPIRVTFSMPFPDAWAGSLVPSAIGIKTEVEWSDVSAGRGSAGA